MRESFRPLERKLSRLAHFINADPDAYAAVQLRRFLWSLYDARCLISLSVVSRRLDRKHRQLVADILHAYIVGEVSHLDVKRALLVAGEIQRRNSTDNLEEKPAESAHEGSQTPHLKQGVTTADAYVKLAKLAQLFEALARQNRKQTE